MRALVLTLIAVAALAACKDDPPVYEDARVPDANLFDGTPVDAPDPDAAVMPGFRTLSGAGSAAGGSLKADVEVGPAVPAARATGGATTVEIESVTQP